MVALAHIAGLIVLYFFVDDAKHLLEERAGRLWWLRNSRGIRDLQVVVLQLFQIALIILAIAVGLTA